MMIPGIAGSPSNPLLRGDAGRLKRLTRKASMSEVGLPKMDRRRRDVSEKLSVEIEYCMP